MTENLKADMASISAERLLSTSARTGRWLSMKGAGLAIRAVQTTLPSSEGATQRLKGNKEVLTVGDDRKMA